MKKSIRKLSQPLFTLALVAILASCGSGGDDSSNAGSTSSIDASGNWSLVTTSSNQFDTTGGACLSGVGTMSVNNQRLSGSFVGSSAENIVTGTIDSDGTVVAQFNRNGESIGNVVGSFSELSGVGTWADIFGCRGDWTATR